MTKQEEQLWNYIDGFCTSSEKAEIEARLAIDVEFHRLYVQLTEVNKQLSTHLEIDEPSMSFTRNVMEQIQGEIAPVKLKTKVDNRIIYAIGGFFSLTLLAALIYAFATATSNFTFKMPSISLEADIQSLLTLTALKIFLFVDAVLLLIYFDSYLRRKSKGRTS